MRQGVARGLLVFQREAVDVGRQHVQLVVTQVSLGRHVTVTTGTYGVLHVQHAGTIQPYIIGQVGRAQQRVTLAVRTVAGHAVGREDLLAGFDIHTFGFQARQATNIARHVTYTFLANDRQPGRHGSLTAALQGGEDLLGLAAPQPVVVGQVREAEGTPGVGTVAHRAVGGEQALTDTARFFITGYFGDRQVGVTGEDRCKLLFGTLYFTLVLVDLGPAQYARPFAHAGVQDQVDHGEDQSRHEQHEPPAGQGVIQFGDAVILVTGSAVGLVRPLALTRGEQQPGDQDKEDHGEGNDIPAPEITHFS